MCSLCWLLWCKYPPLRSLTSYLGELTEKHTYSWSRGLELAVSTPLIHAKRQNMAAWASAWLPCSPQMRVCSPHSSHWHLHNDRRTCCHLLSIFLVRGWLLRVFMSLARFLQRILLAMPSDCIHYCFWIQKISASLSSGGQPRLTQERFPEAQSLLTRPFLMLHFSL